MSLEKNNKEIALQGLNLFIFLLRIIKNNYSRLILIFEEKNNEIPI